MVCFTLLGGLQLGGLCQVTNHHGGLHAISRTLQVFVVDRLDNQDYFSTLHHLKWFRIKTTNGTPKISINQAAVFHNHKINLQQYQSLLQFYFWLLTSEALGREGDHWIWYPTRGTWPPPRGIGQLGLPPLGQHHSPW